MILILTMELIEKEVKINRINLINNKKIRQDIIMLLEEMSPILIKMISILSWLGLNVSSGSCFSYF